MPTNEHIAHLFLIPALAILPTGCVTALPGPSGDGGPSLVDLSTADRLGPAIDFASTDLARPSDMMPPVTTTPDLAGRSCAPTESCLSGPDCGSAGGNPVCCPTGTWCDSSGASPVCRCGDQAMGPYSCCNGGGFGQCGDQFYLYCE
jgi:hypothetical protein